MIGTQGLHEERDPQVEPRNESEVPIARPATVEADWAVKIQRAREAWEAGRRLRKDQPESPVNLLSP